MMRWLLPYGFALVVLLTACSSGEAPVRFGGGIDRSITYDGDSFMPTAGTVRGDLLDISQLIPTDLFLDGREVRQRTQEWVNAVVYGLPDTPLSDGFMVAWLDDGFGADAVGGGTFSYLSCPAGSGVYVLAGKGVPTPPYNPGPEYPGGPTPTPTPTPDSPIVPMVLSAEGLLTAGWPEVDLERARLTYRGTEYDFARFHYVNETGADSAISPSTLEKLETLSITHRPVDVGEPPSVLSSLALPGPVTDRIDVYRLKQADGLWKGWPAGQLLLVDICPVGIHPDQFTLYEPTPTEAP